jgi:cytochrome c-type biogenesis protein CcmH
MQWVNAFWFLAGVLCGGAAALLVLRSWRRSPAEGGSGTLPRWGLLAGAVGIAVVVGLYLWLGRPELIGSTPELAMPHAGDAAAPGQAGTANSSAGSMDAAVARLEARLAQGQGSDADWDLLAQSYAFLGRTADAELARKKQLPATRTTVATVATPPLDAAARKLLAAADEAKRTRNYAAARDAYVKLAARGAMTADTWADYADVTASLAGTLAGEPEKYITQALALDPHHPKALWLQGSLLHETGRYTEAIAIWQRLAAVLDPASSDAKLVAANIEEDRRLGGVVSGGSAAAGTPAAPAAPQAAISGDVLIADALKSRVAAGQTLFIFAKAVDQPGPPVAVLRTTTGRWPLHFTLDDSASIMPTRPLSAAGKVIIEARISKSGQALAAAGDLQGASGVVDPQHSGALRIVINTAVD